MIYNPREDSYLLEKEVKKYAKDMRVLDMGSGSGIQALGALKSGAKSVLCADIDSQSIRELKKKGLKTIRSDLFSNINGKFDLIVFNPPYLPEDKREDEESRKATTGGKKGDEIILRFLLKAKDYLETDGIILLVVSSLTPKERIAEVIQKKKLVKKIIAKEKLFMEELGVWEIINIK